MQNGRRKEKENQFIKIEFNLNIADWHAFTLNEVWKQVTIPNLLLSAKASNENFYKTINDAVDSVIPKIAMK